jgi:hypothetical protein
MECGLIFKKGWIMVKKAAVEAEKKDVTVDPEKFETDVAKLHQHQNKLYDRIDKGDKAPVAKVTDAPRKNWMPPGFVANVAASDEPVVTELPVPNPDDPCSCGSDIAFKDCHGKPAPVVANGWKSQA